MFLATSPFFSSPAAADADVVVLELLEELIVTGKVMDFTKIAKMLTHLSLFCSAHTDKKQTTMFGS